VRVPASVKAGQELEYRILIENTSQAPAHHLVVRNPIPANARFVRAEPEPTTAGPELRWEFGTLAEGGKREIALVLMPTGQEEVNNCARVQFEHGQCVRTKIARPKLAVRKEGPSEANVKDTLNFKITVTNTSDVEASNVQLADILPAGLQHAGSKDRLSWIIGKLAPGESKSVEYQVTAKATGRLCNKVIASADGDVRDEIEMCVNVTEAKIKVSAAGPAKRYLNTPVRYQITVVNEGTALLNDVRLDGSLPNQLSFLSATEGGQSTDSQVHWTIGPLAPDSSRTVELVANAGSAGRLCSRFLATAERGVSDEAEACTDISGVPALSLNVEHTNDPVEVGGNTTYTIIVRNPGSTAATNVRVTAEIPAQMDVVRAAGKSDHRKEGGKIVYDSLNLEAGTESRFEIEVKAVRPGDVRVRVQLTADQLSGGPVQQEESTTIYTPALRVKTRSTST
jgi:uncharacterized repeat protein (TIGR01451 family)